MTKPKVMVLMVDHLKTASQPLAVSENVEKLIEEAMVEDLSTDMRPLRDIGETVSIGKEGDELRIEQSPIL